MIELETNTGAMWSPSPEQIDNWQDAYVGLDVPAELKRAGAWIGANKANRKTYNGMAKFCINWLGRANNNKPAGGKMETPQRKADDPDMWRHWFAVEELIRFRLAGMQPPARKGTFRFNLGRFVDAVIADHPEGVTDPERRASFIYGSAYTAVVSNWAQP